MQSKSNTVKTIALWTFIIGVFMSALDNGIISSALSTINYSFHVNEVQGTWGVTLYTLGMAIATPIVGKLADKYGRKKLFIIEISIFALGSLLVALSTSFYFFLASRIVQSLGGGGIFIIASSYVMSTYPEEKQGGILGALGAVNGIASVVGPNLGSLILKLTGNWHWLFTINLPIAVLILIFGIATIPETKADINKKLDYKGLVLLSFGIFSFMLGISSLQSGNLLNSFLSPKILGLFILGIILFTLFVNVEKHVNKNVDPFLPYKLLRSTGFVLTLFMGLLSGALIATFIFIPSFVEQRFGIPAATSGAWLSGIGMGSIIGAGLGGFIVNKIGATKSIVISGTLSTLGFAAISYLSPTTLWFVIWSTIAGIGFGMLLGAPFTVLMSEIASKKDNGVALGTLSVSRQVGITLAPTLYATVIQSGFSSFLANHGGANSSIEAVYKSIQHLSAGSAKTNLLATFQATATGAYQNMFLLAIIASAIILFGGFYLYKKHL